MDLLSLDELQCGPVSPRNWIGEKRYSFLKSASGMTETVRLARRDYRPPRLWLCLRRLYIITSSIPLFPLLPRAAARVRRHARDDHHETYTAAMAPKIRTRRRVRRQRTSAAVKRRQSHGSMIHTASP